ncbi:MAG: response regulator [Nitrospirae bacterium]|nr:MAG: response regulator [Nitrospirota bacterium]
MPEQREKCPHLMLTDISSCVAGDLPYVPSIFELEEYCRNVRHLRCPFYAGKKSGQVGLPAGSMKQAAKKIRNILIVDDEDSIRQLVSLILRTEGYNVVEAIHGADGLDKFKETEIDMVITDLVMPQMDGMRFTRELRRRPVSMSIPVLMLTTKFRGRITSAGDQAGVNEWLLKPLLHQQLAERVNRYSA